MNYDTEKHAWEIPAYSCLRILSMEVLKEASHLGVNLYEEHLKQVSCKYKSSWRVVTTSSIIFGQWSSCLTRHFVQVRFIFLQCLEE